MKQQQMQRQQQYEQQQQRQQYAQEQVQQQKMQEQQQQQQQQQQMQQQQMQHDSYSGQKQFKRPQPDWSLLAETPTNPDNEVDPRRSRRAPPTDSNPRERAAGADRERISDSREYAEKSGEHQLGRKDGADLGAHLDAILGERDAVSQQTLQGAVARQQRQASRYADLADSGAAGARKPGHPGEAAPRRPPIALPGSDENSVGSLIGHNAPAPVARPSPAINAAASGGMTNLLAWGGAAPRAGGGPAPKRRSDAGPSPAWGGVAWGGVAESNHLSTHPLDSSPKRARGAVPSLLAWDAEPKGGILTQSPCAAASPLPSPLPSPGGSMASRIAQRRREVAQERERERERQYSDRSSPRPSYPPSPRPEMAPRSEMARMVPVAPEDRLAARMARMQQQVHQPTPFGAPAHLEAARQRQETPPPYEHAPPQAFELPPRVPRLATRGIKTEHAHDRGVLAVLN
jgi:hypothetical protein